MQANEEDCIIFDLALALARVGGYGFIRSALRLNVALSRSKNMFMMVYDNSALQLSPARQRALDKMNYEERLKAKRTEYENRNP